MALERPSMSSMRSPRVSGYLSFEFTQIMTCHQVQIHDHAVYFSHGCSLCAAASSASVTGKNWSPCFKYKIRQARSDNCRLLASAISALRAAAPSGPN